MDWRKLEAAVDRTITGAFGERVRLSFMKNGVTDPARTAVVVRALLHVGAENIEPMGPAGTYRGTAAIGSAELLLDRAAYTGPVPLRGDKVRALDRAGEPWFEVSSVSDRETNLITVTLG